MSYTVNTRIRDVFAEDVDKGLTADSKHIPSKYFYDKEGDRLFQAIMNMPEYYLTKCEFEVFKIQKKRLTEAFEIRENVIDLIELGAGDGYKTKVLLAYLLEIGIEVNYIPVDISANVMGILEDGIRAELPSLKINGINADYFDALGEIQAISSRQKLILFLGSNVGNLNHEEAITFFKRIAGFCNKEDKLLIGFDFKKDPRIIQLAYDDPTGITSEFNLNLLRRMNSELGANFNIEQFAHYPVYDPISGTARSFLVSRKKQDVNIELIGKSFHFKKWEMIHTEISQKYDHEMIAGLARGSGFEIVNNFFDCRFFFSDSLWVTE